MYEYLSINALRSGTYFMFAKGTTLLQCYHSERNMLCYTNLITGKSRRLSGFKNIESGLARVRYVKVLNGVFDKMYTDRREIEDMPF